jgi:hypothetical protein
MGFVELAKMILKFPQMREELLGYLGDLTKADPMNPDWKQGDLDYVVHFLFDDSPRPAQALGAYLQTEEERNAVVAVVGALDSILVRYGTAMDDKAYFGTSEWPEVRRLAREALDLLSRSS